MSDWHAWHAQYADPASSLTRRLTVVQRLLRPLVAELVPEARILSLCAGDGRDVIPVVEELSPEQRQELVLVELDPELAAAARTSAEDRHVSATVVVGDAGLSATWQQYLPVDLLMLCGIFGNIADGDIRQTISSATAMLTPNGAAIWTRGAYGDCDLRPLVRQWFEEAGFAEVAFESEPGGYGVGVHRSAPVAAVGPLPRQVFAFIR